MGLLEQFGLFGSFGTVNGKNWVVLNSKKLKMVRN